MRVCNTRPGKTCEGSMDLMRERRDLRDAGDVRSAYGARALVRLAKGAWTG